MREIKLIVDGEAVDYIRKGTIELTENISGMDAVLIRTYSAGIHIGLLKSRDGKEVVLINSRRLYSWGGACSLSQVAVDGVDVSKSKISVLVPEILLTEAIEIIKMTPKAFRCIMEEAKEWKI